MRRRATPLPYGVRPEPTGPGQESVWDYPRPPAVEETAEHVVVEHAGVVVADSRHALRVLETSHPPVYYLPPEDLRPGALVPTAGSSWCEYKGAAAYLALAVGERRVDRAAWTYPDPSPGYERLRGHVAFYPGRVDRVTVDAEVVRPQPGEFYGGWVTGRVAGPVKGGPGTAGW